MIIVPPERCHLLGAAFADALVERDVEATEVRKQDVRAKAFRGPFLVMVVVRLDPELGATHPQEHIISAGMPVMGDYNSAL